MKLLTCIVSYNRLEYTKKTVYSWLETKFVDDILVIVDNDSTDGTREWFDSFVVNMNAKPDRPAYGIMKNERNLFPGAATNIGWHSGLKLFDDVDLLHRSDNDVEYLPGWREE